MLALTVLQTEHGVFRPRLPAMNVNDQPILREHSACRRSKQARFVRTDETNAVKCGEASK
jgi:hypothetical protein